MDISQPSVDVFVDASLAGVGVKWNENVFASDYPNNFCSSLTIVHFEVVNILVTLSLWAHCWVHKEIQIFCDNLVAVNILKSGCIQDDFLMTCARTLWASLFQCLSTPVYIIINIILRSKVILYHPVL